MWSQAVHIEDAVCRSSRRNPVLVTTEYHDIFRCHSVKSGVALSKQGSLRRRIQLAADQRIDGVDYLVIELATADTISVTISHIK